MYMGPITESTVAAMLPSKWGLERLSDRSSVTTAKGDLSQESNPMTELRVQTALIVNWSRARDSVNLGMPNRQGVRAWCPGQRYRWQLLTSH